MSKVTEQWVADPASIKGILVEVIASVYNSIDIKWADKTIYLSNIGYITGDASVTYLPILSGGLQITESISLEGNISMSFGDIGINNLNGELDSWLDDTKYVWVNKAVKVYLGDPRWVCNTLTNVRTDFELVFSGLVNDIDSSSRELINIKIRDSLERLNTPVSENKLGTYGTWTGGQTNQDFIRPIVFGEVFNISPLLIDPPQLEYMFNDTNVGATVLSTLGTTITCTSTKDFVANNTIVFTGTSTFGGILLSTTYYIKTVISATTFSIAATSGGAAISLTTAAGTILAETSKTITEQLIEIRDNGTPIQNSSITTGATIDLTKGTFKLLKTPAGAITVSIQGIPTNINLTSGVVTNNSYKNTIANIIAILCTQYGNTATRFSTSEIDLANFNTFDISNTAPIGYCVLDRENVLVACQTILTSIGAQLYVTKAGLLQVLKLGVPTADANISITDKDIVHHSLSISNKVPVSAAIKLGYGKNWTVQKGLLSTIPTPHKDMFAQEWYSTTIIDNSTKLTYSLNSDPVQKDTMLISSIDADVEATRLVNFYKTPKVVYKFTGTSRLLILKLGQSVSLTHNRFNLNTGKMGQVISLNYNWLAATVDVEVLI